MKDIYNRKIDDPEKEKGRLWRKVTQVLKNKKLPFILLVIFAIFYWVGFLLYLLVDLKLMHN